MLKSITLQNFRNYTEREFNFDPKATLIVGPNTIGKTNILEAIYALATGQSFRVDLEKEVIKEETNFGHITGNYGDKELEVFWDNRGRFIKTYRINGVGKRQMDFVGNLRAVLFSPIDLEIVVNGPAVRRKYLDLVLIQVHKDYRLASHLYEKALRQRNMLLRRAREEERTVWEIQEGLAYWNELLISNGKIVHERRTDYLDFLNALPEKIFPVSVKYDHSVVSAARLEKYAQAELAAGVTLVGPHRDDFVILKDHKGANPKHSEDVRLYGSRGEQRLAVFAVKLGELEYILQRTGENAILLLDDIFSELDHDNRHHVLEVIPKQQTVMTTTDLHVIEKNYLSKAEVITLTQEAS